MENEKITKYLTNKSPESTDSESLQAIPLNVEATSDENFDVSVIETNFNSTTEIPPYK